MPEKIKGGYYVKARCIKDSFISLATPCARETWDYLLREANYADSKYGGFYLKRGQLFRSYNDIRHDLRWKVGYRTHYFSENQMKHGMKALMKALMITVTKAPRGNIITVLNYDYYQDPQNYEGTSEKTTNQPTKAPRRPQSSPSINKKNKNVITYTSDFDTFWQAYPRKENKQKAFEAWQNMDGQRPSLKDLLKIVNGQAQNKDWQKDGGRFIPHPSTWLNGKRWEDQILINNDEPPYW